MLTFSTFGDNQIYCNSKGEVLLIENGIASKQTEIPPFYKQLNFQPCFIIGLLKLKLNSYIIVIDEYEKVGDILGDSIGKMKGYKILPLHKINSSSEEKEYLKLIKEHLNKNCFYFSIDGKTDLTNNFQNQYTKNSSINKEFFWNSYMVEKFHELSSGLEDFVTPIINGYVRSEVIDFAGSSQQKMSYILITRKSINRSGTRYFRRGIDENGNVANFNETEQIIISNNQLLSFLQIRGSVPIYWTEVNNLRYKPNLIISSKNSIDATVKHFTKSVDHYGDVYCINLVNNKGYELPVKDSYESIVNSLPPKLAEKVFYIYFDFHHECKNMKFENTEKLIDIIKAKGFDYDNYFHYDLSSNKVLNLQSKVIRTNCMDCLDRTNVVQSMFSRWILQHQLISLGYLKDSLNSWKNIDKPFNFIFQNIWADNADMVSKSYSSTPALKTDFTRLGKRTFGGSLNDLQNSIIRYYNNNLSDGSRQDSFDLFLGNFKPYQSPENPFIDYRPNYIQLLPYLLTTSILILVSLIFYPKGSIFSIKNLLTITCCLLFQFSSFRFIMNNSYQYVNWPNLMGLGFLVKSKVTDANGNVIGFKFDHSKDFKIQSKKKN